MNERKTIRKIIKQCKNDIKQDELVSDKEDELLQVLDENGKPTGRFEKREIVHGNKLFHISSMQKIGSSHAFACNFFRRMLKYPCLNGKGSLTAKG